MRTKTETILLRFDEKELDAINRAYKKEVGRDLEDGLLSRSEFLRALIKRGIEGTK